MNRSEYNANLALVPLERQSWIEPSPLPRRRRSILRRLLAIIRA